MIVRDYVSYDYQELCKWLIGRNVERWEEGDIPLEGFVVSDDTFRIAMGFLRKIERKTAMIDALCTNPLADPKSRDAAIDLLVSKLINRAKELNISAIISFSKDKNTLIRSEKFGFKKQLDQTIISLSLGG